MTERRGPSIALAVVGVLAAGLNLRTLMAGLPPLVSEIRADLGLGSVAVGVLTTLPVLCMGLFAPPAATLGARFGTSRVISGALVLIAAGNLVRLAGHHLAALYLGTLVAGVGIALAGTLMPGIVKRLFPPHRAGAASGLFMLAMMTGAAVSAALAVPLWHLLGDWSRSLGVWGALGLVGLAGWLPVDRALHVGGDRDQHPSADTRRGMPWRSTTALLLAAYLTVQSWHFYSCLAWLAPTYALGHRWDPADAGLLLSVFTGAQLVSGLVAPILSDRVPDWRVLLLAAAVLAGAGELGVWLAPTAAPWLWAVLLGLGQGPAFALGLVLLVRYAATPEAAARVTALAFLVSYTIAAFGPSVMGAVIDAGGFGVFWAVLVALMVPLTALGALLSPAREKVA